MRSLEQHHDSAYIDQNVFESCSFSQQHLEDIEEEFPMYFPSPADSYPPPETPVEPMEFLSRSWSISALDVCKALAPSTSSSNSSSSSNKIACVRRGVEESGLEALEATPFAFASAMTSDMVMNRILAPVETSLAKLPLTKNHSGPISAASPFFSQEDMQCTPKSPLKSGKSVRKWFRESKDKRKEIVRAQNAQIHAAVSVAGVAAAVAAVAAATAATAIDDGGAKTSLAMASAASLVASQCAEVAETMGADHEQVSSVIGSAVRVKTAGDIMTLTAAAATALRGAAMLKARAVKDNFNRSSIIPYERGFSGEFGSEDSEVVGSYTNELLAKGTEFLKRSNRTGELHWKRVSVYLNKQNQVVLKLQSKHVGGAWMKNKKGVVLDLYTDIPAWPGRCLLERGEQRRYFGLKTATDLEEFECKSEQEHRLWTQGVAQLLCLVNHKQ